MEHAGDERDDELTETSAVGTVPRRRPVGRMAVTAAGLLLALAAWVVLVVVSVRLIGDAAGGFSQAWWIVAIAATGAAAALFLALLLGARLRALWRGTTAPARAARPARPARVKGGKRAQR